MKRSGLSKEWERWRRRRHKRLFASGLASHLAWPIASGEAKVRSRLSEIIGQERARGACVACIGRGDNLRFVLSGPINGLTDEQVFEIEELSRQAAGSSS